jgi:prolyl-tRNA synthetase
LGANEAGQEPCGSAVRARTYAEVARREPRFVRADAGVGRQGQPQSAAGRDAIDRRYDGGGRPVHGHHEGVQFRRGRADDALDGAIGDAGLEQYDIGSRAERPPLARQYQRGDARVVKQLLHGRPDFPQDLHIEAVHSFGIAEGRHGNRSMHFHVQAHVPATEPVAFNGKPSGALIMPATKVAKSEDFMEWYNEVGELAELTDKRYPIKGMNIWRPYGQSIMNRIDAFTRERMEHTDHEEVNFPLMIPEKLFMKEADQIKGFGGEVFWVDRAGNNPLPDGERWVVRPTSECAMYEIFPLWIRSHQDLPLQTFQICNVFRYETKQTRAFMRVREIHFFEDHSVFANEEDARAHVDLDLEIVGDVFDNLALPTIRTKRPDWDKFPGAVESNAADVIMPSGKVLQCATVHYYGTNFSEAYDMTYEGEDGEHHHCHQTTYGMSERLVGAVVGCHGDDNGLIMPPTIAPIQVVIVPVIFKGDAEAINSYCEDVAERLKVAGIRVKIDSRDRKPGDKYYHWELRGVPLRLEIGPRDMEGKSVFAARRDIPGRDGKTPISLDNLESGVQELLDTIQSSLRERQEIFMADRIRRVTSLGEAKSIQASEELDVVFELPIKDDAAAQVVEKELDVKTLGVPVDADSNAAGEICVATGESATEWIRFAKTY